MYVGLTVEGWWVIKGRKGWSLDAAAAWPKTGREKQKNFFFQKREGKAVHLGKVIGTKGAFGESKGRPDCRRYRLLRGGKEGRKGKFCGVRAVERMVDSPTLRVEVSFEQNAPMRCKVPSEKDKDSLGR